jgi:hypothetical protein
MDSDDFDPEAVDEEGEQLGCASRDGWAACSAGDMAQLGYNTCGMAQAQPQHPTAEKLEPARFVGVACATTHSSSVHVSSCQPHSNLVWPSSRL